MKFIKPPNQISVILACPKCRNHSLVFSETQISCPACSSIFSQVNIDTGSETEAIPDFRIHSGDAAWEKWQKAQQEYIKYHQFYSLQDSLGHYLKEIGTVKEIYIEEFKLNGKILDVGGAQGRLRHFLSGAELDQYICIDPFPEALAHIKENKNLLSAYPCLKEPMSFLAGFAEVLPFRDGIFDWVNMRSVLDHFSGPELALREAKRVLKPNGKILIGLSIKKGDWLKGKQDNRGLIQKLKKSLNNLLKSRKNYTVQADDHTFEWSYEELSELIKKSGFKILKEHRQKPPYGHVIYLSAEAE